MKITIIDGQGGRMGKTVIEQLKRSHPNLELYAIGTNSIATAAMLKAGADYGATGENPCIVNARDSDVIIGPIGIVFADALLGEITPAIAHAIGEDNAHGADDNVRVTGIDDAGILPRSPMVCPGFQHGGGGDGVGANGVQLKGRMIFL